jgi:hypothetical protein
MAALDVDHYELKEQIRHRLGGKVSSGARKCGFQRLTMPDANTGNLPKRTKEGEWIEVMNKTERQIPQ